MIGLLLCRLGFHQPEPRFGDCPRCGYSSVRMHVRPYRDWRLARRRLTKQ